jgi:hypothetical protein
MRFEVEGTAYEYDPEKLTFAEARAMEAVTGKTFAEIQGDGQDMTVAQAFVWVAMKRSNPTLKFRDLDDMPVGAFQSMDEEPAAGEPEDPTPPAPADPPDAVLYDLPPAAPAGVNATGAAADWLRSG